MLIQALTHISGILETNMALGYIQMIKIYKMIFYKSVIHLITPFFTRECMQIRTSRIQRQCVNVEKN